MAYEVEKVMAIYSKLYEELDAEEEGPMVAAILTACAVAEDICKRDGQHRQSDRPWLYLSL